MKKNEINTHIPETTKWKEISITNKAKQQILYLMSLNPENKGIRLSVKKSGCAGFRYSMKFIKNQKIIQENNQKDKIFYCEDILIHISWKEIIFFNGIKIDFINDKINKVFKFYNPKIKKFCGCGESFSIY